MSNTFEAPRGQTETRIAQIWSELLDIQQIGRQDDFFELGGHSVLAMGMLSRLRATLDVDVSLTELFRRSQLAAFAEAVSSAQANAPAAAAVPNRQGIPLSPAQERMWLMEQIAPGDAPYHLHWALRLRGPLVPAAMEQALREVQRRHDVLRAVFAETPAGPVQSFPPFDGGTVERFDLSGLERDAREAKLVQMARAHARTPFDLKKGPPLRVHLIKLDTEEWALLVNLHHLVSDGWSLDRFFKDVAAYYSALISGTPPALQPLAMQYADVALAAHESLDQPRLQSDLDYWKSRLRPPLHVEQLPTDFPRPATPSYHGGAVAEMWSSATLAPLQALSRSEGVTLFTTLLSVLQVLLHRRSGLEDIVLGTDVASRSRAGTADMVGLFVNQLVLRTDLSGGLTFRELLQRTRRVLVEALEHQDLPFDRLVRELTPAREVGGNPLFQIMVVLHSAVAGEVPLPELKIEPIFVPIESSPFDLSIAFSLVAGLLRVDCRYRSDLFHEATIQRWVAQLGVLLQSAPANPDCPIDQLEMTPAAERAEQESAGKRRKAAKLDKLLAARPRRVDASVHSLVSTEFFSDAQVLPLLVGPAVQGLTLERFAGAHTAWLEEQLHRRGALLFRGFNVDSTERLQSVTDALTSGAMDYTERSSPRTRLHGNVFTSTDHPADQPIVLHNEQSYTLNWPMKLLFCCLRPAQEGGRTPLADSRRVLARLSASTVERFEQAGVLYIRNFEAGLGVSWREAFQTEDRKAVEAHCAAAEIELEWRGDGLQTRQRRPAVRRHPVTGERVWFNHAFFFNPASLERPLRESLAGSQASREELPFQTCFGDGQPIPEEMLEEIRHALDVETVSFPWRAGDLLLIDNMLVAHGREPYRGARQVAVTMAEPYRSVLAQGPRKQDPVESVSERLG